MDRNLRDNRRNFLVRTAVVSGALLVPSSRLATHAFGQEAEKGKGHKDGGVSPAEDLMREHGALNRLLLIYDETLRRIENKQDVEIAVLAGAADIIRRFVEDYHEKLEEEYLFPRFRKAGKLVPLVDTLLQQHQAGRRVTELVRTLAVAATLKDETKRQQLSAALRSFLRMYRPHEAREDTVLFPAFRGIVSPHEYDALGEQFEKKEDELFGEDGFFKVVDQIAGLEKQLGIYDLSQFSPH
ncbi:MAG: hemerythrin domain-containing protein [Acidobacteriia bacterium]|nr:hemerythrin domain-containing protein [Terriglobia bacterium]